MSRRRGPVVLLTDFGTRDWFVGVMKGVIKKQCQDADIIDICHEVDRQDVQQAEFVLRASRQWFPAGTIFLAIVDPGVGTDRDPVVIVDDAHDHFYVGPNNGLFGFLSGERTQASILRLPHNVGQEVSATFHGRDIFAVAAGRLAAGTDIEELSSGTTTILRLPGTSSNVDRGEIQYFDRFGNAITTIERASAPVDCVYIDGIEHAIRLVRTYADVPEGEALAYWGSAGLLEIGIRNGSARDVLALELKRHVRLNKTDD
ncbi:MAG: SAM hydrolase/SAM-dependent halogenase family protein [Candidatus Sumerlaeaceae bacterium]